MWVCIIITFENFVDMCKDTHDLLPRSHLVQLVCWATMPTKHAASLLAVLQWSWPPDLLMPKPMDSHRKTSITSYTYLTNALCCDLKVIASHPRHWRPWVVGCSDSVGHMSSHCKQQWNHNVDVTKAQTLHGGIWQAWNFMAIKHMHKQWIPGSLSSPPMSPGTRLESG